MEETVLNRFIERRPRVAWSSVFERSLQVLLATLCVGALSLTVAAAEPPAADSPDEEKSVAAVTAEEQPDSGSQTNQRQAQSRDARRRPLPPAAYSKTGYIDNAIIGTQVRFRLDAGFDNVRSDRGEFFYAKCGCYREAGLDPDAPGPAPPLTGDPFVQPFIETSIDHRDYWLTYEQAFSSRFSAFADVAVRSLSPEVNASATGIGDLRLGLKYGLIADDDRALTLQLKAYLPTGSAGKGLGTDHASLEPGLIYYGRVSDRVELAGELRWWLPLGGSTDAGIPDPVNAPGGGTEPKNSDRFWSNVLRYGFGISYDANPDSNFQVAPVLELVGWTFSGGFATGATDGTVTTLVIENGGSTIINLKIGLRMTLADTRGSVYVGYGKALTDATLYDSIIRLEYRYVF